MYYVLENLARVPYILHSSIHSDAYLIELEELSHARQIGLLDNERRGITKAASRLSFSHGYLP